MWKNLTLITQIALALLTPILLMFYVGMKVDEWLKTSPVFVLIGCLLGIGAGMISVWKIVASNMEGK